MEFKCGDTCLRFQQLGWLDRMECILDSLGYMLRSHLKRKERNEGEKEEVGERGRGRRMRRRGRMKEGMEEKKKENKLLS